LSEIIQINKLLKLLSLKFKDESLFALYEIDCNIDAWFIVVSDEYNWRDSDLRLWFEKCKKGFRFKVLICYNPIAFKTGFYFDKDNYITVKLKP
jgi:hypothetical protein